MVRLLLTLLLVALGIVVMSIPRIVKTRSIAAPDLNPFLVLEDSGSVPADFVPTDSIRVMAALDRVDDPELGFSIVELGLIHRLSLDTVGNVDVLMILTMPECPFSRFLGEQAVKAIRAVPGVGHIRVKVDPTIAWDPARLTGEARKRYESVFGNDSVDSR